MYYMYINSRYIQQKKLQKFQISNSLILFKKKEEKNCPSLDACQQQWRFIGR